MLNPLCSLDFFLGYSNFAAVYTLLLGHLSFVVDILLFVPVHTVQRFIYSPLCDTMIPSIHLGAGPYLCMV